MGCRRRSVAVLDRAAIMSYTLAGIGFLQPGDGHLYYDKNKYRTAQFVEYRQPWREINPEPGKFDFKQLYTQVTKYIDAGIPFSLLIQTGMQGQPQWLKNKVSETVKLYIGGRAVTAVPPWNLDIPKWYGDLCEAISRESYLNHNSLFVAFPPTGPTVPSQELHTNGVENKSGFSPAQWLANWRSCINIANHYFGDKLMPLAVSGQTAAQKFQPQVLEFAKKTLGQRLCVQHNSLGVQTKPNALHHKLVSQYAQDGFITGYEMVGVQGSNIKKALKNADPRSKYTIVYPPDFRYL